MKLLFTAVLSITMLAATAQWSNINNTFLDSLHMPVSIAPGFQQRQIILNSYPDGGYFIIWEDQRNSATSKTDIYAQKYDKNGVRLWTENGTAIANSNYNDHFALISSNNDYRGRSYAATDSSGGFFIAYSNDSTTATSNYIERLTVQHVRSNGTGVFNGGTIVARGLIPAAALGAQLIADGDKGCFLAYKIRQSDNSDIMYLFGFRDEGGVLKKYGGDVANLNANTYQQLGQCGIYYQLEYPTTFVNDFVIWSDLYGGCNLLMNLYSNGVNNARNLLGFNRLFRAKKNCTSTSRYYQGDNLLTQNNHYKKDSVYLMYRVGFNYSTKTCATATDPPVVYSYTDYSLTSNGYLPVDNAGYDYSFIKAVTLPAVPGSELNVDLMTASRRTLIGTQVSPAIVYGYGYQAEKFDSVPFQRASNLNPLLGYNPLPPASLDKFKWFRDTLIGSNSGPQEYSLAGGKNANGADAYIAGLTGAINSATGSRVVKLQHLYLHQAAPDSMALDFKTESDNIIKKDGFTLGQELGGGVGNHTAGSITYDVPQVTVGKNGTALFYIGQRYNTIRVSPIKDVATLSWGAMGQPIGSGTYNNGLYLTDFPVAALDIDNTASGGVLAWKDSRYLGDNSVDNIFMRHLDNLNSTSFTAPGKRIVPISLTNTWRYANPAVFFGTSHVFNDIDVNRTGVTTDRITPVASILDEHQIGSLVITIFQQTAAPRTYNGQAYLNRNFTIVSDTIPTNAEITLKLFFSKEEFDLLKNADPSIRDLSYLQVVHQPNSTTVVPFTYAPIAGEEILTPVIDSLYDGYSFQIKVKSLGNFFIQKIQSTNLCAAGSTSYTSSITGSSYQWQVSTGGNFTNLSNGGNYAGATTANLQVTNIPAAFNGNRYRCVVNGNQYSNTFFMAVNNSWTGAVNNLWENIGNWSCGKVPDATTDVVIKSGTITINSAAICRSLTVSPTVNMTVTPGSYLTVVH